MGQHKVYEYDTGDSWDNAIELDGVEPLMLANGRNLPRCTGGENAAPDDDTTGMYRHCVMVYQWRKNKGPIMAKEAQDGKDEEAKERATERDEAEEDGYEVDEGSEEEEEEEEDEDVDKGEYEERLADRRREHVRKYDPLKFDKAGVNRMLKQNFQMVSERART